ncbi:5-formyltetrahydrofolate cyclo-ligase [Rhodopseudomonas thermotolerans]|uniref:5-formyltetrahydrofolate cyclo-ligase n=2 Tax=Rhodopseudomonas TaxID=1073 RepID=A0A336JRC7_9BRAD|nr:MULTISPECIES: 5-formyltetrahydrofolate cyclo-ligase [Rhodopseudomonas]RED36099.1 5-formyltetrahydrofolate cyclo-ligase [Rhodopseudomonas pentothenatexigens]REG03471.1 5-formyltetrahydrofolate cyclo-ligase [Rhodopseudomonas thermotolerans]SSW90659.1 5-formyltetrahydrofolate cyclo-ligase [Rhodopseudomonas pentothenatexigens]
MSELSESSSETKTTLRAAALARRSSLSEDDRSAAAAAVASHGLPVPLPEGAVVAGYAPIRGELDPFPLMQALAARGARLALPVVVRQGTPLTFRAWRDGDALPRSALGIPEPSPDASELTPDIVLVPLAAFDANGHRIGYGAGHYDCTLEYLRAQGPVVAIGLAFAMQQIPVVPAAAHDVVLDYVLTEQGLLTFRSR